MPLEQATHAELCAVLNKFGSTVPLLDPKACILFQEKICLLLKMPFSMVTLKGHTGFLCDSMCSSEKASSLGRLVLQELLMVCRIPRAPADIGGKL